MSILLDALRKTEQSQRRGSVPTLDTQLPPAPPPRRVAGWLPWSLLVLVVCAGAAAWWRFAGPGAPRSVAEAPARVAENIPTPESAAGARTTPENAPETAPTPAATTTRRAAPGLAGPAVASGVVEPPPPATPADEPVADRAPALAASADEGRTAQVRTPVERPVAPLENAAPVTTPAPGERVAPVTASSRADAEAAGDPAPPAARAVPDPVAAMDATAEPAAPARYEGEPLALWSLPPDVRSRLPEFRLSVLVYAARPADRFALVNGKRLGEGDALAPGLDLVEIRRDGAVFTFERYRFLVGR